MLIESTFLSQLSKFVSLKTYSRDVDVNKNALDYLQSLIHPNAQITRIQNLETEILIASNCSGLAPEITFLVHMDVVPGQDKQFDLKIESRRAVGRGASDMKFALPIGVALLNELIEKNVSSPFAFVVTTDEERGGTQGAQYAAEKLRFSPKILIVPDGGDNLVFVEKAKGVCSLIVSSRGIPAHASQLWEGKNALVPLLRLGSQLSDIYEKNNSIEGWETTMNIGQIHGGVSTNQVCPEAFMKLDFRYTEKDSVEFIVNQTRELANNIDSCLEVSVHMSCLPMLSDSSHQIAQSFTKRLNAHSEQKVRVGVAHSSSDARHFYQCDSRVLMLKPLGGGLHSDYEWIDIDSCMSYYRGVRDFIFSFKEGIHG